MCNLAIRELDFILLYFYLRNLIIKFLVSKKIQIADGGLKVLSKIITLFFAAQYIVSKLANNLLNNGNQ